jgi:hypothetical protein
MKIQKNSIIQKIKNNGVLKGCLSLKYISRKLYPKLKVRQLILLINIFILIKNMD